MFVCVLKGKDGKDGVRIAVDYRYLNKYCEGDAYLMPEISDLIQKVGKSITAICGGPRHQTDCFCQSKVDCHAKGLVHHRKGSVCSYLGSAKIQKLDFWSTHHCDIKSAYHQIEVKPEHQWLTAFVWDGGLYQYTRAL